MKRIIPFLILIVLLANCHEPKDSALGNQVSPFNKSVGEKIPMDVAQRWIAKYRSQSNARTEEAPNLSQADLGAVLNPIQEKLGVSFHRAMDADGGYHILVVPVSEGVSPWENTNVLDANTNTLLASNIGAEWAERYKTNNPDGIWSHFFGIHVFEHAFGNMELVEAQNDQGVQQLLLFVWGGGSNAIESGRSAGAQPDVYDHSVVCPPNCSAGSPSNN